MSVKRVVLLLLVCVCVCTATRFEERNATTFEERNGTGRTFVVLGPSDAEPIPDEYLDEDGAVVSGSVNGTSVRVKLSEEARLFLTGPLSTVLIPSFYTVVCCVSVPINICAILAFARGIRPKKPAAIYMLNLALADLLFTLVLPFKISYHFQGNDWRLGSFLCRAVTTSFYWNMYCSVLLIACISMDRLLAVVYPINSLTWRRPHNSIIACAVMWVLSFAGSVPLVITDQTVYHEELDITTCHEVQLSNNIVWMKIYFIILCCALFFLPLLITVVSYTRVIWSLSRVPHGHPGSSHRRMRAVVMAVTVLVIFVLCFMPTNCLLLTHYLILSDGFQQTHETAADRSYVAYLLFLCVGSLNCLLDPLVYYFGSSQCQRQLSSLLRCHKVTKNISHSTSDSWRSSKPMLKPSRTGSSTINTSIIKMDEAGPSSQYKQLLV
ncbi:proteinase-activated receptor 1-like [Parambassis ranga]|uniref:Proteinase-activated receptor 1 n=1 Tax=Parambassis ranga TaxID=210632 RepID=A0A6P7J9V1_9TELE|nr:proteinase-activated receptor 1-like [Parambassis ranga]